MIDRLLKDFVRAVVGTKKPRGFGRGRAEFLLKCVEIFTEDSRGEIRTLVDHSKVEIVKEGELVRNISKKGVACGSVREKNTAEKHFTMVEHDKNVTRTVFMRWERKRNDVATSR